MPRCRTNIQLEKNTGCIRRGGTCALAQLGLVLSCLMLLFPGSSMANERVLQLAGGGGVDLYQKANWLIDPLDKYSPEQLFSAAEKISTLLKLSPADECPAGCDVVSL